MNTRDLNLKNIRPLIPTITEEAVTSPTERFQNQTLRPILKLQNDLLIVIFQQYTIQRKGVFSKLSISKKVEYLEQSLRKDLKFRSLLIGSIVGQFTLEEWKSYVEHENELRKRLISMLIKRLVSQVDKI